MNLVHGDCFDQMKTMEDESVDVILTDPPYGMSFRSSHRKIQHKHIENDHNLREWIDAFTSELYRVSKNNTAHYVFCSWHNVDIFKQSLEKLFTVKNILVWEKNNTGMGDLFGDFAPKHEFIIFLHKGRKLRTTTRSPNIFKFPRTQNSHHPTEKPVALLEFLLVKFGSVGDVVFDPFMGSGSTGVACVNMNRYFIGIELDSEYVTIAKKRIKDAQCVVDANTEYTTNLNTGFEF